MSTLRIAKRIAAAVGTLAFAAGAVAAAPAYAPVRIIAFNDVHGYLSPSDGASTSIVPLAGVPAGVSVKTGGLAYMKTLITSMQAGHPDNIVVAAGDNIGASPYTSGIAHDEPTVDVLNQLGLQVSSVGNHEFDKGLTELKRIQGSNGSSTCYPFDGHFGVVGVDTCLEAGNTFKGANWTYLAANVTVTATGQTIFPATYLKTFPAVGNKAGATVGFVGLTFKDTPLEVNQTGVAGLSFGDEASAINKAAASLKKAGAQAVVVLIHQGAFTTSTVYGDNTCPGFAGDLLTILDKLSENVDVVVSGHTHTDYICSYKGKLVTQSGFYGTGLTTIDLTFDGNEVGSKKAVNTPVINDTNTVAYPAGITALVKDATVDASIQHYASLSAAAGSTVVGSIAAPVTIAPPPAGCAVAVPPTCDSAKRNKTVETAMGDLSADAYFSAFTDAQVAFVQAGGVRTTLKSSTDPVYPGPITYAALFATNPFHDTLVEVSLTGPQIKHVLEQQWEAPNNTLFFAPGGVGEILMPSASFSYTWDSSQPAGAASGTGNRVVASSMKINGVAVDMTGATSYRVVIQTFLASGGDDFTGFTAGTSPVQGGFDIDALVKYMAAHPNYAPVTPNRVTKLGSNP